MEQKAKQLTDTIKEFPKNIELAHILKTEELSNYYLFETDKSYLLVKTY